MTTSTRALITGHYLTVTCGDLGTWAECECGMELEWGSYEEQHFRHILAIVWQQGFYEAHGRRRENPYQEDVWKYMKEEEVTV